MLTKLWNLSTVTNRVGVMSFYYSKFIVSLDVGRAMRKRVIGHMRTTKGPDQPAQSDQGIHWPLTGSLDNTKYINGGQIILIR